MHTAYSYRYYRYYSGPSVLRIHGGFHSFLRRHLYFSDPGLLAIKPGRPKDLRMGPAWRAGSSTRWGSQVQVLHRPSRSQGRKPWLFSWNPARILGLRRVSGRRDRRRVGQAEAGDTLIAEHVLA